MVAEIDLRSVNAAVDHGGGVSKLARDMKASLDQVMNDLRFGSLANWEGQAKQNCLLHLQDYEIQLSELCANFDGIGFHGVKYANDVSALDAQLARRLPGARRA